MKKILVVDDDKILRTVLKHTLEQEKYQVTVVGSGTNAMEAFENDTPDIIISDVSMPEMDGFEFCRRLRSRPTGQLVPFIFLSARGDLEDRIQGHSIGADDYLVKPFEIKELLAKIEALIEKSRRIHSEIVNIIGQFANGNKARMSDNITSVNQGQSPENSHTPEPLPLTPAEERVFWEVIQGFTNKQISDRLFISPRTVQTHLSNILNKLNLENRTQLVRFAFEKGYEKVQF
ncbi:Response regulator containing a CheY-like receiver domain and an HTH DNA-binding domain [Hyella patelloides LEGE 07179]|uniref:Response regulator containing a CheY-like receiver domain and an HTH DNA-binding domain n=1 Tax=Hyella patelloides LEGE 07179 TaxID=945734 RepID=A0A563VPH3_9CYAN|nr:response regulator transcription factor [Hyella patelloides]VEP13368.1 Response regulator containing a CheY-like receiver domain and an HTH DNA-binding domain [Hyella patelloides LEGE 07179]